MMHRLLLLLGLATVLFTQGCGLALTHYLCHKTNPEHGCDRPQQERGP